MVSKFDKTWDLPSALWLTYLAKTRAEAAGGVGKQSDIIVITHQSGAITLDSEDKKILSSLFSSVSAQESKIWGRTISKLDGYIKKQAEKVRSQALARVNWEAMADPGGAGNTAIEPMGETKTASLLGEHPAKELNDG